MSTSHEVNHRSKKSQILAIFLIAAVALLAYCNTFSVPFVFNDYPHIVRNDHIRLQNMDFEVLWSATFESPYRNRPLANTTFALNYIFGGYDVFGYHLVNTFIHIMNGILVFFLSLITFSQQQKLSDQKGPVFSERTIYLMALFAALIFVAHPIQIQGVTYIVQRMTSMATMFYLLALLLYIQGRVTHSTWRRWTCFSLCLVSWILALGSKEIAATFPFIVLLYEWFFLQDLRPDWVKKNLKYLIGVFIVFGLVAFVYLGESALEGISKRYENYGATMGERVLAEFRIVVFYISLLLWPDPGRFNLYHSATIPHSLIDPITTLLSLCCIIGLLGAGVYLSRKYRLMAFCISWFSINLVIKSSIIPLMLIFEHRLYLPMLGCSVLFSYLLFWLFANKRVLACIFYGLIVLSLAMSTRQRNKVWRDEVTLWGDAVAKNPCCLTWSGLASGFYNRGAYKKAVKYFTKVTESCPKYAKPHYIMGDIFYLKKEFQKALKCYSSALKINPYYIEAHLKLGHCLMKQGKNEEAIVHFRGALRLDPNHEEIAITYEMLGISLVNAGEKQEGIKYISKALGINPNDPFLRDLNTKLRAAGIFKRPENEFLDN